MMRIRSYAFSIALLCLICVSCGDSKTPFFRVVERGLAGLHEKSVQAGDHRIAYLEGGAGADVLLIQGFGADKDNWDRFARRLTGSCRVIAPDLPGFGDSSKIRGATYNIPTQAAGHYLDFLK